MSDKMMRIAGRGSDGTAKAIKTDDNGVMETKVTDGIGLKRLEYIPFQDIQEQTLADQWVSVKEYNSLSFSIVDDFDGQILVWGRSADDALNGRELIINSDNGLIQSRGPGVNKRGFYHVDLTGVMYIRFRVIYTSGNVTVKSVLSSAPVPSNEIRTQKLMYGAMGFDKIVAGTNDNYGTWYCIRAVTDCIIGGFTRTDALEGTADGGSDSGSLEDVRLQAGETLYGAFARIHLTEGECLAYRVNLP